jgi:hypothetical protein
VADRLGHLERTLRALFRAGHDERDKAWDEVALEVSRLGSIAEATRLIARGGAPCGLSPLARQGNLIIIEEASHDACLFPRIHGAEAHKPRVQTLKLLYGERLQGVVFRS